MNQLSNDYVTFVATHPVFLPNEFSKLFKDSLTATFLGLGLPIPSYHKKEVWGYEKSGAVYYPIEKDLAVYYRALAMAKSRDYAIDDIITWVNASQPTKSICRRNFFYLRAKRPLFPEFVTLSLPERIQLVSNDIRITAPTA